MLIARARAAGAVLTAALVLAGCTGPASPGATPSSTAGGTYAGGTRTAGPGDGAGPGASSPGTPPVSLTILAAGDVLAHMPVNAAARRYGHGDDYDFRPMLAPLRDQIAAADLAICHLETPLSAHDTDLHGYPLFNSPREIADALRWAGFDGCSTASNHSLDQGLRGLDSTLDILDHTGLQHAGTARTRAEAEHWNRFDVRGVTIAHLSFTYGTNGIPVPASAAWAVDITSASAILARAHRARAEGAQFVIVSLHWGTEYQVTPSPQQRALAQRLLASDDIDLLIGDHAHVQQPVERIGSKYVIYGLGNLLSNQSPAAGLPARTQDGSLITVRVAGSADPQGHLHLATASVWYTPTFCTIPGYIVRPAVPALGDPAVPAAQRAAIRASLARTEQLQGEGVARLAAGGG